MEINTLQIQHIVSQFFGDKNLAAIKELDGGNINTTYLIRLTNSDKAYVLQKINNSIFKDVPELLSNIKYITRHFHKKLADEKPHLNYQSFRYYATSSNYLNYYKHADGSYWRICDYIENTPMSADTIDATSTEEAGRLFGYFIQSMSDIDLKKIVEIIPGFHDSNKHYKNFLEAISNDLAHRLRETKDIHTRILNYKWLIASYRKIANNKDIPLRLVHNDTKIDNILFNEKNQAIALIDLDTCMPGYAMSDFGDSLRSIANNADENETDLEKVSFNIDLFKAYAIGFIHSTKDLLVADERKNLAFYVLLITYEQTLRFYTDYLNGDSYYKIKYPEHNIDRCRNQLTLLDDMFQNYDNMKEIITDIIS